MMTLDSIPVVGTVPEVCAGCPVQADVNQQIMDLAVSQLQGSGGHVEVYDVPWLQQRELAQTNCSRD